MAGLLFTPSLNAFPLVLKITSIKVLFKTLLSLQQQDCCRFSRHSLLIAFREIQLSEPMCVQKYSFQIKNNNLRSLKLLCVLPIQLCIYA